VGFREFFGRLAESDEDRLSAETREWVSRVPGTIRIAEIEVRQRVRVAGVVRRITVWPREGDEGEYLDALISDGTGEINAEWLGRRSIPGLSLGTHLMVEGMLREERIRGIPTITNPKFEFV